MKYKILLIEDNKDLQDYLRSFFLDHGYSVEVFSEGLKAINDIDKVIPDLVILDLGLPDISGENVFREIKKILPQVPIIILTAKGTKSDIIAGFNLGADDYLPKPFDAEELLARVKARLKQDKNADKTLKVADLILDPKKIEVKRAGKRINLTQKEFKLLEFLMRNKGQVLSRDVILDRVWSYTADIQTRAVDVYIGYVRKKINKGSKKKLISSIRGFGYIIKD